MDAGMIVVIIVASIILGTGVYFQVIGKKNIAKAVWAGLGVFVVAMGFANTKKLNKIKEGGQKAIDDSKENDENRTEIVEEITEQIKTNKDLIDEINEALGNDE